MIETMADTFDGLAIARQRIAEEAEARTGFLDLSGLGLTVLPPELFRLRHLRTLNLGAGILREEGTYQEAYELWDSEAQRNEFAAELGSLLQLPELVALSVSGTSIADLTPLADLAALQSLD
jgi:internalin A